MFRRLQHLRPHPLLHHLAGLHHHDAVGDVADHAEIVRDEQDGGAAFALQVGDQPQDLRLRGDVERGRRLVRDQQDRVEQQRARDDDALRLPAGELVRIAARDALRLRQADGAEHVHHAGAPFGTGHAVDLRDLLELRADADQRVEAGPRILEDHRHPGGAQAAIGPVPLRRQVGTLEGHAPAPHGKLWRQHPHDRLCYDRLARPAFPHEADRLAGGHVEADILHGEGPVSPFGQGDRQAGHGDDGLRHSTFRKFLSKIVTAELPGSQSRSSRTP